MFESETVKYSVYAMCYVKHEAVLGLTAGVCVNKRPLVSTVNSARDWRRWITELGTLQY